MSVLVRRLRARDLEDARPLLAPEGWSFETHELERLRQLGGAVGAYVGGRLVGFLSYVDTPPVRWIGNVAVHPGFRGLGVGQRIVSDALRDAPRVALYSVEKAVTLYMRLGFAAQGEMFAMRTERAKPATPAEAQPAGVADLQEMAALDRALTGMDRARMLRSLLDAYPTHVRVVRHGGHVVAFGFAKVYADVTEVGPIVARDATHARQILDALVRDAPGPHEIAVHGGNAAALAAAQERGFETRFRAVPMFRGEPPAWTIPACFAAAGLEKG